MTRAGFFVVISGGLLAYKCIPPIAYGSAHVVHEASDVE